MFVSAKVRPQTRKGGERRKTRGLFTQLRESGPESEAHGLQAQGIIMFKGTAVLLLYVQELFTNFIYFVNILVAQNM